MFQFPEEFKRKANIYFYFHFGKFEFFCAFFSLYKVLNLKSRKIWKMTHYLADNIVVPYE